MNDEITFRLVLSSRQSRLLVGLAVFFGGVCGLHSENLTVTSFYPSPSGIYKKLVTTDDAKLARDAGRVGIRTGTREPAGMLDVGGLLLVDDTGVRAGDINVALKGLSFAVGGNSRIYGGFSARDASRLEGGLTVEQGARVAGGLTADWASAGSLSASAATVSGLAQVGGLVIVPGKPEHPMAGQLWLEP